MNVIEIVGASSVVPTLNFIFTSSVWKTLDDQ